MRFQRIALLAALLVSAAPLAGAASEAAPPDRDTPAPRITHELWLKGPFGRLPGGSVDRPAVAEPGMTALDTFSRNAPLSLDGGPSTIALDQLTVRAIAVAQPDAPAEILSTGDLTFAGPSRTGTALLVAELIDANQEWSQHAWLLEVPDRPAPADGLLDIPAPDTLVEADSGSVVGSPGDGCYIDLCVEIGMIAPVEMLPALTLSRGEPLSARLSDGSAIIGWEGSIEALSGTPGRSVSAQGAITDEVEASVGLVGLQVPGPGTWLLTLKVFFDRERGWMTTSYRLEVER